MHRQAPNELGPHDAKCLIRSRVRFFVGKSCRYAGLVGAYVAALSLLTRGEGIRRLGLPWWVAVLLYFAFSGITGAVVGLLDPHKVSRRQLVPVGNAIAVPLAVILSLLLYPDMPLKAQLGAAAFCAVVTGSFMSLALYPTYQRLSREFLEQYQASHSLAKPSPDDP